MKKLNILILLACLFSSSNSAQASDIYAEIYPNGTIRCHGDIIQADNITYCYSKYSSDDGSTSSNISGTTIGFAVFSAVLGAYIVQPSWDYFFKPRLIKVKDNISPYIQAMYEYMHSKCSCGTGRIPCTKRSDPNMDDIHNIFRSSVPINFVTDLKNIDEILLELKWKKKPIVFPFKGEGSVEEQKKSERLVGYAYTGFASAGYRISLISGWSEKSIGKNSYHLNSILNHEDSYEILNSKVEFFKEDLIEIVSYERETNNKAVTKSKKPKGKGKAKEDQDQSYSAKRLLEITDLVDDILLNLDSKIASILTSFVTNTHFETYNRLNNGLYIVLPKIDETDLSNAYIKLEKIKFKRI